MIIESIALLVHYKTEQLFLFQEAADHWEGLKATERELLKQKEQSFEAYLRAHSIYCTTTGEIFCHSEEKEKYLLWADELKKTLANKEGIQNYNKFSSVLDQFKEAQSRIETILLSEEAARYHSNHNKKAAEQIPELKKRYNTIFAPISQSALERREKEAKLPIFSARIEGEGKVSMFYIHFGGTGTELESYLTRKLAGIAGTKSVKHIGDLVFIQSNNFVPPKIGNDPVLTSLGIPPEIVKIDYPKK